jgi:hypothetical protein
MFGTKYCFYKERRESMQLYHSKIRIFRFRQGDVLLLPTGNIDGMKLSHLILAEGEVTGHKHQITKGQAELYEKDETLFLKVLSEVAILTHEEHQPIQLPQGNWMVRIQREYEPTGWRYVED